MSFRECVCRSCGCMDDPVITQNGPHLNMHCDHCGDYLGETTLIAMPDIDTVKRDIWRMLEQSLEKVKSYTNKAGTAPIEQIPLYIYWWNIYLQVKHDLRNKTK